METKAASAQTETPGSEGDAPVSARATVTRIDASGSEVEVLTISAPPEAGTGLRGELQPPLVEPTPGDAGAPTDDPDPGNDTIAAPADDAAAAPA